MIEKNHPSLSVGAQCCLLSISRSSFYYEQMGETALNLDWSCPRFTGHSCGCGLSGDELAGRAHFQP